MKFHHNLLFISLLLTISNTALTKNNTLIDRLLLSINDTYYTQRQMEAYLLIKAIIFPKKYNLHCDKKQLDTIYKYFY